MWLMQILFEGNQPKDSNNDKESWCGFVTNMFPKYKNHKAETILNRMFSFSATKMP